jgi:hypothetical protein
VEVAAAVAKQCPNTGMLTMNFIVGMFLALRGPSKRTEYPGTRPSAPSKASALSAPAALAAAADASTMAISLYRLVVSSTLSPSRVRRKHVPRLRRRFIVQAPS